MERTVNEVDVLEVREVMGGWLAGVDAVVVGWRLLVVVAVDDVVAVVVAG